MAEGYNDFLANQISSSPSSSFLLRLAEGDSLLTGLSVFRALVNVKGQKGIYISCNANSPYAFLNNYFAAHNIDTSKVLFVDSVSKPLLGRATEAADNVFFTEGAVTEDSLAILRELVSSDKGIGFVYFDSITELLKFHGEGEIRGFLADLVNLIKQHRITGVILSYYGERETELVNSVMRYCDHCLDL